MNTNKKDQQRPSQNKTQRTPQNPIEVSPEENIPERQTDIPSADQEISDETKAP
jgi:hypothetical protein